jgi:glutathione S-transferase
MSELVLHQPPTRPWGTPNTSTFCVKLETYLRVTETPYTLAPFKRSEAPKGKIPYVFLDGEFIGDSQLIIDKLEHRAKQPLDAGLSPRDRATAHMLRRALEEGLYFVGLYIKWELDGGYRHTRDEMKQFVPAIALPIVRRIQRKKLHAQGTGRHTHDEVMAIGIGDIDALAALLGDSPFLLGAAPRVVDCTAFAFVETIAGFPLDTPVKQRVLGHANLVAYRNRFRERWWKDLPELQ